MADDRVDVLIITALREELEAARNAALAPSPGGRGVVTWAECDASGSTPYWRGEYRADGGRRWTVGLARPTEMSGRSTGPTATSLVDRLRPSCLAMCGVCAGHPDDTALGDVVVAEVAYEWDEGMHSPSGFVGDHRQIPLDPRWLRAAQDLDPATLPSHGSASPDEAMLWLLERLHQNQDPREQPARGCYFTPETWKRWLTQWESDGLITRDRSGAVVSTDSGTRLMLRRRYDDPDGPRQLPFRVLVAPMASGSAVMTDDVVWSWLARMGMRRVTAVEMEAATIATVARQREVPHWLVAKGVMDHATVSRDDRYRHFAARASAEVLYALLDRVLPAELCRAERRADDRDPPSGNAKRPTGETSSSAVNIGGDNHTFHGPVAGRDIRL